MNSLVDAIWSFFKNKDQCKDCVFPQLGTAKHLVISENISVSYLGHLDARKAVFGLTRKFRGLLIFLYTNKTDLRAVRNTSTLHKKEHFVAQATQFYHLFNENFVIL